MICSTCRQDLAPGEAIEVLDTVTSRTWHVHRPMVDSRCFQRVPAGPRFQIRLADPDAAVTLDRELGGTDVQAPPHQGDRL
jgi:hypothetical protein